MRPKAKDVLKDPDMCNCVKNFVNFLFFNFFQVDDVVDDVWPDIMDEIQYNLMMTVS